jgi:hypothetical protein
VGAVSIGYRGTRVDHGTVLAYGRGCRCDACCEAIVERGRQLGVEHGKESTYRNYRCRCAACRAATNANRRRREHPERGS